ncbi:MAG: four helix bundle protein [Candidatus Sumerlaeota bacterium]|nr:four helix bundle protein [Candidatus Sumerlaeota bacterium]
MKGDDLSERFLNFAARIIKLASALPKTFIGRHIAKQLVECGTSTGANYEEARGAESKADFVHKLGVVLKELRETYYWLRLIDRCELLPHNKMQDILSEAAELCKIIGRSIKTARGSSSREPQES